MSSIIRAGGTKGSLYGDSSNRTAAIRSRVVKQLQFQKTGDPPVLDQVMSGTNQAKKPLISEHHLTKGSTNGVMEFIYIKNKDGFF